MNRSTGDQAATSEFEEHRRRLVAVAYRMLGSRADAEDVVQEAWLRFGRQDHAEIKNLGSWLNTVVARICIDELRSRRRRTEVPIAERLPELIIVEDDESSPEDDAVIAESVGLALLVVLETLGPAERLAFVLHDIFDVPFNEIGQILGRTPDATKMLASRARRKVKSAHQPGDDREHQRAVVNAFLLAAREGDFEALLSVLDPDVTWRSHGPQGLTVQIGATEVAAMVQRGARARGTFRPVLVNGQPGVISWGPNGTPLGVMACTVVDGRIVEILSVLGKKRLAGINLPDPPQ